MNAVNGLGKIKSEYCSKCSKIYNNEWKVCEDCENETYKQFVRENPVKLPRRYLVIVEYSEPFQKKPTFRKLRGGICYRAVWLWFSLSFIKHNKINDFILSLPTKKQMEKEARKPYRRS